MSTTANKSKPTKSVKPAPEPEVEKVSKKADKVDKPVVAKKGASKEEQKPAPEPVQAPAKNAKSKQAEKASEPVEEQEKVKPAKKAKADDEPKDEPKVVAKSGKSAKADAKEADKPEAVPVAKDKVTVSSTKSKSAKPEVPKKEAMAEHEEDEAPTETKGKGKGKPAPKDASDAKTAKEEKQPAKSTKKAPSKEAPKEASKEEPVKASTKGAVKGAKPTKAATKDDDEVEEADIQPVKPVKGAKKVPVQPEAPAASARPAKADKAAEKADKKPAKKATKDEDKDEEEPDKDEEKDTAEKVPILDTLVALSGVSKEEVLQEFVSLIYDNTHCVGGKVKDTLYKELPNTWSQRKNFTDEEKKYECDGEGHDDCTVSGKINKSAKGNVKLIWKFNKTKTDGTTVSLSVDKKWKALNKPKVLGFLKKCLEVRKDVFLKGVVQINTDGHDSEDHRGSNHCLIDLPVDTSVKLTDPSLEQFIEAFWMIKFKKFDRWYELCVGSKVTTKKGMTVIDCAFDNGS